MIQKPIETKKPKMPGVQHPIATPAGGFLVAHQFVDASGVKPEDRHRPVTIQTVRGNVERHMVTVFPGHGEMVVSSDGRVYENINGTLHRV